MCRARAQTLCDSFTCCSRAYREKQFPSIKIEASYYTYLCIDAIAQRFLIPRTHTWLLWKNVRARGHVVIGLTINFNGHISLLDCRYNSHECTRFPLKEGELIAHREVRIARAAEGIIAGKRILSVGRGRMPRREVNYPFTRISVSVISALGLWNRSMAVIVQRLIVTVNYTLKIIATKPHHYVIMCTYRRVT